MSYAETCQKDSNREAISTLAQATTEIVAHRDLSQNGYGLRVMHKNMMKIVARTVERCYRVGPARNPTSHCPVWKQSETPP